MTSLLPTEDETMLDDMARGFLSEAAPVTHLRAMRDAGETFDPDLWAQMVEMGWAGVLIPEAAGGSGMGHAAAGILARAMGRTLASSPFIPTAVIAPVVFQAAHDSRHEETLRGIAEGKHVFALAVDEGPKHDPENTKLVATRAGNVFRLSGLKTFVRNGNAADRFLVLAKVDDQLTLFDVPSDREGIQRTEMALVDSQDAARVQFLDVELRAEDIVGEIGGAMAVLRPALAAGQAALAAEMAGLASGIFDLTMGYLKERKQFGKVIGSFQALQHRAAKLWCEMEVTESAVIHAGRMLDESPEDATLAVSLASARAIRTAALAVQEGVQLHGGIGMTDEYDAGFYMKRAQVGAEWLGDYGFHAARVAALRGF